MLILLLLILSLPESAVCVAVVLGVQLAKLVVDVELPEHAKKVLAS